MKREEYRSILKRLPIKSPTPQDMAMLCPHLTAEEAVKAFMPGSGYVACPPLLIRNSFHNLYFINDKIEWLSASRTYDSYINRVPRGGVFSSCKHMDKAMKFAEDNWGNELILDDWVSMVEFYIDDPTDLMNEDKCKGYPRTKIMLYVALNCNFDIVFNDHSKPASEILDNAISQMTSDPFEWDELRGGRTKCAQFNCAHCGAGLSLTVCPGCGHKFRDNYYRCGWPTPLSRKMVSFLRDKGHVFKVDPEIAQTKERQCWELKQNQKK